MPLIQDYQIPPPRDWQKFEDICCDIWRIEWGDLNTEKNGRSGQDQKGVDISGRMNEKLHGVQCKGKDGRFDPTVAVTETELRNEVEKAKKFTPSLFSFVLATTAPSDQVIQEVARQITDEHDQLGLFSVTICSWDDITSKLSDPKFRGVFSKYYPDSPFSQPIEINELEILTKNTNSIESKVDLLLQNQTIEVSTTVEANDNDSVDKILDSNIDQYMELSKKKPKQALQQLKELKIKHWDKSSRNTKFRIVSNLANLYLLLGNKDKAIELYFDAEAYAPENKRLIALNNKAHAYILNKQQSEAIKLLKTILVEFPDSEGTHALVVGANIENKNVKELELLVPTKYQNTKDVTFTLGLAYSNRQDWDNAYIWLEKSLEKDKENIRLQEMFANVVLQRLVGGNDSIVFDSQFSDKEREQFHNSLNLLQEVWDKSIGMETEELNVSIAFNLSYSYKILGDIEKAQKFINIVLSINPKYLDALKSAVYLAYANGEKVKALDYITNFTGKRDTDLNLLHSEILAYNGKYEEALKLIKTINVPKEKFRLSERKISTEFRLKYEIEDDLQLEVERLEKIVGNSHTLLIYITLIDYYLQENNKAKASELARSAAVSLNESNEYQDKNQLADLLISLELYELAVPICRELVVTKDIISVPLKRYFHSLLHADKRSEALKVLEEIPKDLHNNTYVLWFKAEVHSRLGEHDKARVAAEELLENELPPLTRIL